MALKATICKATVQLADIDRGVYGDYPIVIARHPSETDERMLIRLLAFALNVPADGDHGALEFAKDMWDADEPGLWQKDLTGHIMHWMSPPRHFTPFCESCVTTAVFSPTVSAVVAVQPLASVTVTE